MRAISNLLTARRGSTSLQVTTDNQTRSYLVAAENLDNIILPARDRAVRLITSEYNDRRYSLSLEPVDFQNASELNVFDLD